MSQWPAVRAQVLLRALLRIGWSVKRQSGSHRTLSRSGCPDYVFAFHDGEEFGLACLLALPSTPAFPSRTCRRDHVLQRTLATFYVSTHRRGPAPLNTGS